MVSSDGFVTEEDEPTLKDMLNAIGLLAICITANESRFAHGPPPTAKMAPVGRSRTQVSTSADTPPEAGPYLPETLPPVDMEGLPQVKDQVRVRIADRLRGVLTTYLCLMDDESDHKDTTLAAGRRKNTGVSSKL